MPALLRRVSGSVALFTLLFGVFAQASHIAQGMRIHVAPRSGLGQVQIHQTQELIVPVEKGTRCPAPSACQKEAGGRILRMQIQSKEETECGALIYRGVLVGSATQERVTVVDNSSLNCFIRLPVTEVYIGEHVTIPEVLEANLTAEPRPINPDELMFPVEYPYFPTNE